MSDLAKLARPFPREMVQGDPGGNSYVAHENVTQWLLGIVGPFDWTLVEILRGDVPGKPADPKGSSRRAKEGTPDLHGVIVGAVYRLTLTVDQRVVHIEEAGDVEDPHNWRHDGQRLKQAASDAIKRCAMRVGLGLHLWAGERYVLDQRLEPRQESKPGGADQPAEGKPQEGPEDAAPKAPVPTQGPGEGVTPPDFDHLTSPGLARAWLRGQPEELRALVEQDATAAGVEVGKASLDDLRRLILAAWQIEGRPAA